MGVFKQWGAMRRFKALPEATRTIVFYAEDGGSWPHLGPLVEELTGPRGRTVCYLTSSPSDPVLASSNPRLHAFCIGEGMVRTWLFSALVAKVLVLTMPDLETFHVKRSKAAPVHYVYVFHSLVSTHMIYRKGAFDHYDTLLCCGPHHVAEVRANEERYGLKAKRLIEHGYGRLDTLLAGASSAGSADPLRVLVAPSWGPRGLLETRGEDVTRTLLDAGYQVTVRPHPMTRKNWPQVIAALERVFGAHERFTLDVNMRGFESLARADALVSDWSGAALEYAFGFERPVLFVDVPRKVNNPDYQELGIEPLEVSVRTQIGELIGADALATLPAAIERVSAEADAWKERIRAARAEHVFHVGSSHTAGAEAILELADGGAA